VAADGDHLDVRPAAARRGAGTRGIHGGDVPERPSAHVPDPRSASPAPTSAPPRPWRTLVLGGARSGKSAEAELRLAAEPEVTYVAAAGPAAADDTEWAARVAAHRARRPHWWRTVETTDVAEVLMKATGGVLIDSIGTWLAAVLHEAGAWRRRPGDERAAVRLAARIGELADAWRQTRAHVVAVSEEAGSGIVPGTQSGRIFRDELGSLNQLLASQSEEAILVVAGRALSLPG
jgi:adenosylcobinamide kinase / adenosylcobinamide-phosphate guanylyltransferase